MPDVACPVPNLDQVGTVFRCVQGIAIQLAVIGVLNKVFSGSASPAVSQSCEGPK